MNQIIILFLLGVGLLWIGAILGYYARQSIAKKKRGSIEARLQKRIAQTKEEAKEILNKAHQRAKKTVSNAQRECDERRNEILKTEKILLRREHSLDEKISDFEKKEKEAKEKFEKLKKVKEEIEGIREEAKEKLEKISGLSKEEAKKILLENIENDYQKEILERIQKLNHENQEKLDKRAKEIVTQSIQKYGLSQAQ
jgi:ribonuclease Y